MSTQSSTSSTPNQKPIYSYKELITMAINSSPEKALQASDITNWIRINFPHHQKDIKRLQKSVSDSLSKNDCFVKLDPSIGQPGCKIFRWTVVPVSKSSTPNYTYENLIKMAFSDTRQKEMLSRDIINWISENFPSYQRAAHKLKVGVQKTLSQNKCFLGMNRPDGGHELLWTVFKPDDPLAVPHVEFVGETMKGDMSHLHPQADVTTVDPIAEEQKKELELSKLQAEAMVGSSVQANMNPHSVSNRSVCNTTNSDGSKFPQSSNSSTPIHQPNVSTAELITTAINSSPQKTLLSHDIINWISENFPFYQRADHKLKFRVRSTLSRNKCFLSMNRPDGRPGLLWTVAPKNYNPCNSNAVPTNTEEPNKELELSKFQAEDLVGRPMQTTVVPHFGSNHLVCFTRNSDGLKTPKNSSILVPIQKLNYTYKELIMMAIIDSPQKMLSTCDIINWISRNFPYYRKYAEYLQKSVRSELIANKCFSGMSLPGVAQENQILWTMVPENNELGNAFAMPPTPEE